MPATTGKMKYYQAQRKAHYAHLNASLSVHRVDMDLSGLWKDEHFGLLVHLRGIRVFLKTDEGARVQDDFKTVKGVARVSSGEPTLMRERLVLTSVMPKRPRMYIRLVEATPRLPMQHYHTSGSVLWDITGVLVPGNG